MCFPYTTIVLATSIMRYAIYIGGSKIVGYIPFGPQFLPKQVAEPDRITILFVCIIDDEYGL